MTPMQRDYLIELTNAESIEDLWRLHCQRMSTLGFDRLFYGFTRFRTEQSLGDPDDFILLSNHDQRYVRGFIDGGLYRNSPMLHWALSNEGSCSWAALGDMVSQDAVTPAERRVMDFNASMDVVAGYTVSFKSVSSRAKGAISLCGRPGLSQDDLDAIWAKQGADIVLMNNLVHLKILTLPYVPPNQNLTPRQREALEWVGDGKTMQDIAQIMGLTQATVEKHLRLAREALNVDTTAQAVLKAAFQNQMFVVEA